MKKIFIGLIALMIGTSVSAQTDVTNTYIENPDFGARFAAWVNPGSFTYNVTNTFTQKSGQVWMEKWVSSGGTLGNNAGIYQTLRNLKTGTYTLVVGAQNIQQSSTTKVCTGAFVYAGNEQTEINKAGDYSVVFTVVNGKANIGVRLSNCTGNWVCIDNFRLYYNGENADSIAAEQARVDNELKELKDHLANATGTMPKVTTNTFVPTGCTIALGRISKITGTVVEKGFCWSTNPEPTILDEKTTETFSNNGDIYVMRGLKPSTTYYVRAYAMTSGYQVGYGDVIKINTLRAGNMRYGYDNAGDEFQNARINSASAECIWMYNQLSYIPGFYLNVHYVYGAGAGDGTADCSYGGWMRVSQKEAYQQTGTILHETNHGVGVGTTGAWYNNANLRADVSRGLWLGPRGTQMVRFFENNTTATMTGDNTHMWPYGINGAQEDSYQPSNHCLYFANILITHALHQDGLPCTSGVGFAMPAYVFQQDDNAKYYIQCEDAESGGEVSYLGMTSTGTLRSIKASPSAAMSDDNLAWKITFNPKTSLYILQNVGTGRYLTNSSGTIASIVRSGNTTSTDEFHFMPSRNDVQVKTWKGTTYWILTGSGHKALEGGSYNATGQYYNISTKDYNASNSATAQRWVIYSNADIDALENEVIKDRKSDLARIIAGIRAMLETPHITRTEDADVNVIDAALAEVLNTAESITEFNKSSEVDEQINALKAAAQTFLADTKPATVAEPFDISFVLANPGFDNNDTEGWTLSSGTANCDKSCVEFVENAFDMNQTTDIKLPLGTYELRVQAFQRPGVIADVYADFVTNGINNAVAKIYIRTKNKDIHNICDTCSTTSITGGTRVVSGFYVPSNLNGAQNFFKKGFYENSQLAELTSTSATIKVGIKSTGTGTNWWTCADNFRLLCHGDRTTEEVTTGIESTSKADANSTNNQLYDLTGRRTTTPKQHGIYVRNGKKILY